jgi:hypothetical protein
MSKKKFIIVDSFDNHCFKNETFDTYEDGWTFLYLKYPVIKNADGTQNDRDEELGEYYVVPK